MKKAFSLIVLLIIVVNIYSQTTAEYSTADYYLQKSKSQNKTGWILLGVGSITTVIGFIGFDKNFVMFEEGGNDTKADIYGFVTLAGLVMDIASIPVFISASRNKKRAATLVINNQILPQPINSPTMRQSQIVPTLTLKISL